MGLGCTQAREHPGLALLLQGFVEQRLHTGDCPILAGIGGQKDTMVTTPAQKGCDMAELGRKVWVNEENFLHNIRELF